MMWAPPPLFSMTTCWPHISDSRWPMPRATTSLTPPAAAVTTIVTVLVGNGVCACAEVVAKRQPSESAVHFNIGQFLLSPLAYTSPRAFAATYHTAVFEGYCLFAAALSLSA